MRDFCLQPLSWEMWTIENPWVEKDRWVEKDCLHCISGKFEPLLNNLRGNILDGSDAIVCQGMTQLCPNKKIRTNPFILSVSETTCRVANEVTRNSNSMLMLTSTMGLTALHPL